MEKLAEVPVDLHPSSVMEIPGALPFFLYHGSVAGIPTSRRPSSRASSPWSVLATTATSGRSPSSLSVLLRARASISRTCLEQWASAAVVPHCRRLEQLPVSIFSQNGRWRNFHQLELRVVGQLQGWNQFCPVAKLEQLVGTIQNLTRMATALERVTLGA